MGPWKILAISLLALLGSPLAANENAGPLERMFTYTTFGPTMLSAWSTFLTNGDPKPYQPAKTDALAFIGSDGHIRGAQFEQAFRYYHTTHRFPLMSDMQLAQAIATQD
ncbi:hypothetical protein BLL37_29530 [Pseudomonas azotoformans]|uniref:DUF2388 domain-containing protein n=1 Tax=Pseudomonas azotoformans TaxID=47878 RepID=A0A1V2J3Z1_PSEAZ|nr:DUF2388 domain-containing protein [Pseudomonas azotoformans]OIN45750.1 hypothetical protein BFL39_23575 [Pseudomonas azotoformans]ONH40138.1 hypothetical protein BLL37_29530 [Pseudomonas azotoformans]SDN53849.1 conserverd hypothetical protein [Pseudomonas azotoformans]